MRFVHGDAFDLDWSIFDGFYFYNPFPEQLLRRSRAAFAIDDAIDLRRDNFDRYLATTLERLASAREGTRVVTYHGLGGDLPAGYELRITSWTSDTAPPTSLDDPRQRAVEPRRLVLDFLEDFLREIERLLPLICVGHCATPVHDLRPRRPRGSGVTVTAATDVGLISEPAAWMTSFSGPRTRSSPARRVLASRALADHDSSDIHRASLTALAIGALGVVFGDIGTSPLYTLQMAGSAVDGRDDLLGVLSLIFWGLTLVVAIKYLVFVMRADNRGEGGILALLALIPEKMRRHSWITLLVIAGAALLFGDGIITPAISVLSAIEGLKLAAPDAFPLPLILAITIAILIGLFAIQRRGTGAMGRLFGPVMVVWFLVIGALGLAQVVQHPDVLAALSPSYGVRYFAHHGWHGFPILGVVVLCLTGGEALYADMGHFGARPIRVAWFVLAMPALVLCYFGQGALMLHDPSAIANPFFSLVPVGVATYLLVGLATCATIIASQALISGVFSMTHQAIQLGLFPRVQIKHTSAATEGQIYVPQINWGLAIACALLVLFFQESSRLAAAFGIAVSGTMAITSITYYVVTRQTWHWPRWKGVPLLVLFLSFDVPFFAANLGKFVDGGYVPIVVGAAFFTVMAVWRIGKRVLREYTHAHSEPIAKFLKELDAREVVRVPGTGVFLTSVPTDVPLILEHHIQRIRVLHEHVVLLTIAFEHVPFVSRDERLKVEPLSHGFTRIVAHYGFMDQPDIPAMLREAKTRHELRCDLHDATFYLGRETFLATRKGKLGPLRERVFAFLSRNATSATSYFAIPPHQVVELGTQIDL